MKIRELEAISAIAGLMADGRQRTISDIRVRTGLDDETISEAAFQMTKVFGILDRSKTHNDDTIWIYQASKELRET